MKLMWSTSKRVKYSGALASQSRAKQGGIFHFVGIFVGIGFFRWSINLINIRHYRSNSIPIEATELNKPVYSDANMSEYERLRSVLLNMSNSRCFDL